MVSLRKDSFVFSSIVVLLGLSISNWLFTLSVTFSSAVLFLFSLLILFGSIVGSVLVYRKSYIKEVVVDNKIEEFIPKKEKKFNPRKWGKL